MEIHSETAVVVILLSGLLAQWLAWRLKVPGIVLLTIAGVLLGPVSGIIVPARDFGAGLSTFVQLSVAIILFEGGLNLRFHELGEAQTGVRRLVVLGLPFSFLMGTLAAVQIGGLSWPSALLFGAIIVVTNVTIITVATAFVVVVVRGRGRRGGGRRARRGRRGRRCRSRGRCRGRERGLPRAHCRGRARVCARG